jgi:DDE superfamily endonuclease
MPQLIWLYLTALLYYRTSGSCIALAEALQTVSHDRLTRMLQADWPGQTLLESAWRTLFVCERGYLIIDDTVVPKPFATAIEGLAWVFSSRERKPVYGFSLVLLIWTNGTLRIPLGVRLWRGGDTGGGPGPVAGGGEGAGLSPAGYRPGRRWRQGPCPRFDGEGAGSAAARRRHTGNGSTHTSSPGS